MQRTKKASTIVRELEQENQLLRGALLQASERMAVGAQMANLCYNLGHHQFDELSQAAKKTMCELQIQWDRCNTGLFYQAKNSL